MSKKDVLQGTLTLLILKTLSRGSAHGYGITNHIQRVSSDQLRVEEGSLYPALHRMEQEGWIASAWGITESNRKARFYSLTPTGQSQLEEEEQSWARLIGGVASVLQEV